MIAEENKIIIERYIECYNNFDIVAIFDLLDDAILFRHFSHAVMNVETRGKLAFKELAEKSSTMFSTRRQLIGDYRTAGDAIEVEIDYEAILAIDLPTGLKTGDRVRCKGKSMFQIKEGKIVTLEDYIT